MMKTKIIQLLLFIEISIPCYLSAQIQEVKHLPAQNQVQEIIESVPVWLSETDIMIFYVNQTQDTIFSTKSTDKGVTWEQPSLVIAIDSLEVGQELIYPTAIKTETGRILLAWSVLGEGINLIYSDDSGNTWSDIQIILGAGSVPSLRKNLSNPKISMLSNNRLLLNFNRGVNNPQSKLYYRISDDNGLTWGDTVYTIKRNGAYYFEDQTIIENPQGNLLCVFKLRFAAIGSNSDIYARFSYDNGATWGDTVKIAGNELNESTPRITMDGNGKIWLAYLREDTIKFAGLQWDKFINRNVFYKTSSDGGLSWSDEMQFTYYIGDDNFLSITANKGESFISYSTPKFTNTKQITIGYLNTTTETYTPPVLFKQAVQQKKDSLQFLAYAKDDNEIEDVVIVFDSIDTELTLYDDGLHDDQEADDDVYGNRMLIPPVNYNNNSVYINSNKLKIPFENSGVIAMVTGSDTVNATFNLTDVENNSSILPKDVIIHLISGGQYDEGTFLFSSGFFLSGFSNGELWTNGVAPSSLVED